MLIRSNRLVVNAGGKRDVQSAISQPNRAPCGCHSEAKCRSSSPRHGSRNCHTGGWLGQGIPLSTWKKSRWLTYPKIGSRNIMFNDFQFSIAYVSWFCSWNDEGVRGFGHAHRHDHKICSWLFIGNHHEHDNHTLGESWQLSLISDAQNQWEHGDAEHSPRLWRLCCAIVLLRSTHCQWTSPISQAQWDRNLPVK